MRSTLKLPESDYPGRESHEWSFAVSPQREKFWLVHEITKGGPVDVSEVGRPSGNPPFKSLETCRKIYIPSLRPLGLGGM